MYLFQLQNLETPVWISLHIGDFAFELITGVEWTNQNTSKVTSGVLKYIMRETTFSLLSLYWSLGHLIMEQSFVTRGNRMHTNNHEYFVLTLFFLLTGNSEHTVTNSAHFLSTFSIVSFDVESLFTNVPIDAAVQATLLKFENDSSLVDCTTLTPPQIADLLNFVLRST